MKCEAAGHWLDPLLDGELDSRNAVEVQTHLDTCPECQGRFEAKQAVSVNLRRLDLGYTAPDSLRARIAESLAAEVVLMQPEAMRVVSAALASSQATLSSRPPSDERTGASRGPSRWLLWAGWPVALAASAMLATVLLHQRDQEADTIVAAHVRSLLANHLNDVVSSSHHTVKPWFAGKIDFSPPVPDLSSLGFELLGGRLDYLEHQPVAAVVYRKHGHIINVLMAHSGSDLGSLPQTARAQGYSLRAWKQGGLDVVAVSDIDPLELDNLQRGYETPPPPTAEPPNMP
jgi:anti-sigma factor RsiW